MASVRNRFWFYIFSVWIRICNLLRELFSLPCPHSLSALRSSRPPFSMRVMVSSILLFCRIRSILEMESVRKERLSSLEFSWFRRILSTATSSCKSLARLSALMNSSLSTWHCCSSQLMYVSSSRMFSYFSSTTSAILSQFLTTSWILMLRSYLDNSLTFPLSCATSSSLSRNSAYNYTLSSYAAYSLDALYFLLSYNFVFSLSLCTNCS